MEDANKAGFLVLETVHLTITIDMYMYIYIYIDTNQYTLRMNTGGGANKSKVRGSALNRKPGSDFDTMSRSTLWSLLPPRFHANQLIKS